MTHYDDGNMMIALKFFKEIEKRRGWRRYRAVFLVPLAPRGHPTVRPRVKLCT